MYSKLNSVVSFWSWCYYLNVKLVGFKTDPQCLNRLGSLKRDGYICGVPIRSCFLRLFGFEFTWVYNSKNIARDVQSFITKLQRRTT